MEYKKMEHSIGQAFHWAGLCEIEKISQWNIKRWSIP